VYFCVILGDFLTTFITSFITSFAKKPLIFESRFLKIRVTRKIRSQNWLKTKTGMESGWRQTT